ncbi:MAG: efflux RND transporter permease subunit, partial [Rhodanobacter sp.]
LALIPFIPTTFIPVADQGRSMLSIELPPGTPIEDTAKVTEHARAWLGKIPELKQVFTQIGSVPNLGDPGKSGDADPRKAVLTLDWGNEHGRDRSQKQLEQVVRDTLADLPGARVSFISAEPGEQLMLVLAGDNPDQLDTAASALERDLRKIKGLGSVSSTASLLRPELQILPDPARAADLGVSTAA